MDDQHAQLVEDNRGLTVAVETAREAVEVALRYRRAEEALIAAGEQLARHLGVESIAINRGSRGGRYWVEFSHPYVAMPVVEGDFDGLVEAAQAAVRVVADVVGGVE